MNRILLAASILLFPSLSMAGFWGATTDPSALPKSGGTMTGHLTIAGSSLTVGGAIQAGTLISTGTAIITGNLYIGPSVSISSVVSGRWSQTNEADCGSATPDSVGQFCLDAVDDPQAPFHVATNTVVGSFARAMFTGLNPFGMVMITTTTSAETTIGTQDTFVKVAGTSFWHNTVSTFTWDGGVDNRITYQGVNPGNFLCQADGSISTAGSNEVFAFRIVKNGQPDTLIAQNHTIVRKVGAAGDQGAFAISRAVQMARGDYVELWIANTTDTDNGTVESSIMWCTTL